MNDMRLAKSDAKPDGDTPALRLFGLLEVIAEKDQSFNLQALVEETGLPKPTLHRMLQQLEAAGLIQRNGDGRQYGTGLRLRRLAENLLLNSTSHGARHMVLRRLVEEVGESCNLTAFSGGEVLYLDRVETAAPLRDKEQSQRWRAHYDLAHAQMLAYRVRLFQYILNLDLIQKNKPPSSAIASAFGPRGWSAPCRHAQPFASKASANESLFIGSPFRLWAAPPCASPAATTNRARSRRCRRRARHYPTGRSNGRRGSARCSPDVRPDSCGLCA